MDDAETVKQDTERLDHLEQEIKEARHHLDERTHQEEEHPEFYEDNQDVPEDEAPATKTFPPES